MAMRWASLICSVMLVVPATAQAELAAPVRDMINAAVMTGDARKVSTVVELAKQTNPDDTAEIDELHERFLADQRELSVQKKREKERALRDAGIFDDWSGKGQIGAFQSSGNSETMGVSAALSLERTGIDWQHRMKGTVDYQRSNGATSREQYLMAYEPRYRFSPGMFAYALAQYESDRIQGFSSRYALSGGIGYQVIDNKRVKLSLKAGPAWRQTNFVDGTQESNIGALGGLDFDWKITRQLTLTQATDLIAESGASATAFIDSASTSILLTTGLEAKISDGLTTRLSYTIDYDSNPPVGGVSTDTLTRFTLVYGF